MKTVASIIAASLALAPAAVAAQAHDQVVEARIIVKTGQPTDARRSSHQSGERAAGQRERDRAQARAEQNRRQNRDQQTEKTSRTLKVGANGEIDLSNLSGDIIVTRGSGNTAQLEILETARGRTVEDARSALSIVTVDIVERGSRVEVKAVYPRHDTRSRERQNLNVSVQYTLTAPENTRISAQTLSGDIRTTDIKGDLNLVSLSGDVTVTGGARVMSAKSTSGDVQIVNLRSEIALEANAVSGDVVIRDSRVPRMEAGSISGDIVITNVVAERVEAQTLNGDIEFRSPLDITTFSGTVVIGK